VVKQALEMQVLGEPTQHPVVEVSSLEQMPHQVSLAI